MNNAIARAPVQVSLSPSQLKARDAFETFIQHPEQKEMVIAGPAGSGKTFLVQYLVDLFFKNLDVNRMLRIPVKHKDVAFCASTHKACGVLNQTLNNLAVADDIGIRVRTIHSFLDLKIKNNYKTGAVDITRRSGAAEHSNKIIFVDEASMIDESLLYMIRKYTGNCKIVYIGDSYQLPPVKKNNSPVFSMVRDIHYLTEIQRQAAQNPIIQMSERFRQVLDSSGKDWFDIQGDDSNIVMLDGKGAEKLINDKFATGFNNDFKILAWSNKKVIEYNKHVRSLVTPEAHLVPGEMVVTNKFIFSNTNKNFVHAMTDSHLRIADIKEDKQMDIEGYSVRFSSIDERFFLPADLIQAKKLMNAYAKNKNWKTFFEIKDHWLDIRPAHALTVHKAQGSTYDSVFIDLSDIGRNTKYYEVARLLYVAITRAASNVYLYGELPDRYKPQRLLDEE